VKKPKLIVITGPTASGKSALAVEVASRLDTGVISADSRQVYKGIPVVTAVPTQEERRGVAHHLLEVLPLDSYYSASEFERDALAVSEGLFERNGVAVVCGGSMMYVDALCNGIDELPTVPEETRTSLMESWRENGDAWLLSELESLDPEHFRRVDQKNMKRVFHAVEVSIAAGRPYSSMLTGGVKKRDFEVIKICLDGDRQELFGRINRRVEYMMARGLEEEARSVYPLRHLNSLNTVGLKEMFLWFDGIFTKEEAVAKIQKNTRVYAKKQLTWYKRDEALTRMDFSDGVIANAGRILDMLVL